MENNILGFMSKSELTALDDLFCLYNYYGAIGVEVGSLHGRSSYQIASTIYRGTLYCIDNWAGWKLKSKFTEQQNKKHNFPLEGSECNLETFLQNTKDCKNIIPIKGNSPNIVKNWSQPIDFLFLDGSHYNPNDWNNIEFWLPKIKPYGILSGHDYRPLSTTAYPDINENIDKLEKMLNQKVKNPTGTSIWYFEL
jgi:hypothetical protein